MSTGSWPQAHRSTRSKQSSKLATITGTRTKRAPSTSDRTTASTRSADVRTSPCMTDKPGRGISGTSTGPRGPSTTARRDAGDWMLGSPSGAPTALSPSSRSAASAICWLMARASTAARSRVARSPAVPSASGQGRSSSVWPAVGCRSSRALPRVSAATPLKRPRRLRDPPGWGPAPCSVSRQYTGRCRRMRTHTASITRRTLRHNRAYPPLLYAVQSEEVGGRQHTARHPVLRLAWDVPGCLRAASGPDATHFGRARARAL